MSDVKMTVESIPAPQADMTGYLITVEGQLDESNIDERAKEFYAMIEKCPKKLFMLFDLQNLEYMNSKTIGYLTDWAEKVMSGGGRIVISRASTGILDILTTVGITSFIKPYTTLEEAKANLFI